MIFTANSYLSSDAYLVFVAAGKKVYAWRRGTELKHCYVGHEATVRLLMPFGPHLITVDDDSEVKIWDIKSEDLVTTISFPRGSFSITSLAHPATYINKVLFGSKQGSMQV